MYQFTEQLYSNLLKEYEEHKKQRSDFIKATS